MKGKKIVLSVILTMLLVMNINVDFASAVSSDGNVRIHSIGEESIVGGESATITFEIENKNNSNITIKSYELSEKKDLTVTNRKKTGLNRVIKDKNAGGGANKDTISFVVNASKRISQGTKGLDFKIVFDKNGSTYTNVKTLHFDVLESLAKPDSDHSSLTAFKIEQEIKPSSGFSYGVANSMKIKVVNYGNTTLKDAKIILDLPEGLAVNNGSNSHTVGYISRGSKKEATFEIVVDESVKSKSYPIKVELMGKVGNDQSVSTDKTFYISVNGKNGINSDDLKITNMSAPENVKKGQPFRVFFDVVNEADVDMKNAKIKLELPEGMVNKTRNIFIKDLKKHSKNSFSVNLFPKDEMEEKTHLLKVVVSNTEEEDPLTQYIILNVISDGSSAKKPQLMVDDYGYGGNVVEAGKEFDFNIDIKNTSNKNLSNIKVSLSSDGGAFVPARGSNSFYIENIKPKGTFNKTMRILSNASVTEKTAVITVNMTYEDGSGNSYDSTDTIYVPTVQKTRLVVDEIITPMEIYVGMPNSCDVQFYNMGKTTLENLRINCKGNFDISETNSYYAGNMESGKSDTYSFNFIPREAGEMSGIITFTYENSNGDEQFLDAPFRFDVMEMIDEPMDPWGEDGMGMEEPEGEGVNKKYIYVGLAILLVLAIVGVILFKKIKARKMNKALEIEDMDIEDTEDNDEVEE